MSNHKHPIPAWYPILLLVRKKGCLKMAKSMYRPQKTFTPKLRCFPFKTTTCKVLLLSQRSISSGRSNFIFQFIQYFNFSIHVAPRLALTIKSNWSLPSARFEPRTSCSESRCADHYTNLLPCYRLLKNNGEIAQMVEQLISTRLN